MVKTLVVWVTLVIPRLASATEFTPFAITPHTLRERVETTPAHESAEGALTNLKFELSEPGLRVTGFDRGRNVSSVRRFADLFFVRYRLTLVLAKRLGRSNTPAFSGVVLDRDERIIANFTLLNGPGSADDFVDGAERAGARIERFSRHPAEFLRVGFENLREDFGFERDAKVNELWAGTKRLRNIFWHTATHVRRVLRLFSPGRPTWLLIDMDDADDFSRDQANVLRQLTASADQVLERIVIYQPDRVIVIEGGRSRVYGARTCELELKTSDPSEP